MPEAGVGTHSNIWFGMNLNIPQNNVASLSGNKKKKQFSNNYSAFRVWSRTWHLSRYQKLIGPDTRQGGGSVIIYNSGLSHIPGSGPGGQM